MLRLWISAQENPVHGGKLSLLGLPLAPGHDRVLRNWKVKTFQETFLLQKGYKVFPEINDKLYFPHFCTHAEIALTWFAGWTKHFFFCQQVCLCVSKTSSESSQFNWFQGRLLHVWKLECWAFTLVWGNPSSNSMQVLPKSLHWVAGHSVISKELPAYWAKYWGEHVCLLVLHGFVLLLIFHLLWRWMKILFCFQALW